MTERYINPFTDFGFKKLFGEEANKDLLIDFLNELLADKGKITELTFLKNEHLSSSEVDRKAIFDLYCQTDKGEKFIVELQKAKQKFFKDRSLYYSTFANGPSLRQEQAKTGEWDFRLQPVYTFSIMDFSFDEAEVHRTKLRHDIQLIDTETQTVFYDKLRFIYLEMPKFDKTEDELQTHYDKWLFVLKNLAQLDRVPPKLQERVFLKLFEVAELAKFNPDEQRAYQSSVKYYRDIKNSLDTAFEDGMMKRTLDIARNALIAGLPIDTIINLTGLRPDEIEALRDANA